MAGAASDFAVAAMKLETCIPIMLETDLRPLVGGVALTALGAKLTAVNIVQAVAIAAFGRRILVTLVDMALLA